VDNSGEIYLNGSSTGFALTGVTGDNFNNYHNFEITTGFQVGTNSLEVHVVNAGIENDPGNFLG